MPVHRHVAAGLQTKILQLLLVSPMNDRCTCWWYSVPLAWTLYKTKRDDPLNSQVDQLF